MSAIIEKINSQIKKSHLKMIPIKDNYEFRRVLKLFYLQTIGLQIKVKLATSVEGEPKAPFSDATTSTPTPFLPFILDPYLIVLSVKQGRIKYFFKSLVWFDLGLNFGLPDHWRTLWSILNMHVY